MKRNSTLAFLLLVILLTIFVGCSSQNKMDVEKHLSAVAREEGISSEQFAHLSGNLKLIKFESGRYELVDKQSNDVVYYIQNANSFYKEEDAYADFVFNESKNSLEDEHLKNLKTAKTLACQYIDTSTVIHAEDKASLKKTIQNVNIHYGSIPDNENNSNEATVMITHGTHIYVLEGYESYYNVATFLHELVHVISNETNVGSKYEMSFYRFSAINEGLTELITRQILIDASMEYEINTNVTYDMYFTYVYTLLKKVDLISCYFYSDNYDIIFEDLDRDWVDVYYMIVDWGSNEDLINGVPFWVFAQF